MDPQYPLLESGFVMKATMLSFMLRKKASVMRPFVNIVKVHLVTTYLNGD